MIITCDTIFSMLNEKELTVEMINENIDSHIADISKEFKNGFEFIRKYSKSVTIFGSSRLTPSSKYYQLATELAGKIVTDTKYTVITGGGPGIMEAANLGAKNANGKSVGLNITIKDEQHTNTHTTDSILFDYFFTRKTMLNFAAEAYVFFPGGYGTFDELFGILTLIDTKKIPIVPIILFGKDFWNPLEDFFKKIMIERHNTINESHLDLFTITDSIDEVIEIIKKAPVSQWWKIMD